MPPADPGPVVLFDGVCNLCDASVRFIVDRDSAEVFRFASLDSSAAHALLEGAERRGSDPLPDSVLLVEEGRVYDRSTAALRIARRLGWPWKLAYAFVWIPRFVRDAAYDWVARRRYAWFGKKETCLVPTPEIRARFLS
jgi:predicted DCC family thiol-disulfide oxidoreductase YuxK